MFPRARGMPSSAGSATADPRREIDGRLGGPRIAGLHRPWPDASNRDAAVQQPATGHDLVKWHRSERELPIWNRARLAALHVVVRPHGQLREVPRQPRYAIPIPSAALGWIF